MQATFVSMLTVWLMWYILSLAQLKGRRIVRGRDKVLYSNFVDWGGEGGGGGVGHFHVNKLKQAWFTDDFRGNNGMHPPYKLDGQRFWKIFCPGVSENVYFGGGRGFLMGRAEAESVW